MKRGEFSSSASRSNTQQNLTVTRMSPPWAAPRSIPGIGNNLALSCRSPLTLRALWLAVGLLTGGAQANEALRRQLTELPADGAVVAGVELASVPILTQLYRERDDRLLWDPARATSLLTLIEASQADGFQPDDFHYRAIQKTLEPGMTALATEARVALDILLSDSLLRYLHHHHFGKVAPATLGWNWRQDGEGELTFLMRTMREALAAANLAGLDRRFRWPRSYLDLRRGLARYRQIADQGGWPQVADGETIRPGMQDRRVPLLRARLGATSDYVTDAPLADPWHYDEQLQTAVERFQARHGLLVDGLVGPRTRAALNIKAPQRVDQIRVNLERLRWVMPNLPRDFILVNIPAYRVDLYRAGDRVWSGRAIVGRPARKTPVFRDELTYLELNPTWTVPPTIFAKDFLPSLRKDPSYLHTRGLRVIDRQGRSVTPEAVDWSLPARAIPYLLRQPPGDQNALGRIKFMFPNRYSVYLHDTPNRVLFNRPGRALSSGCIRVENPLSLAELILNDPQRWTTETIQAMIETGRTRVIRLESPLPVLLAYWTAEVDGQGEVTFRNDIYGRDALLLQVIDGGPQHLRTIKPPADPQSQTVEAPRADRDPAPGAG